MISNHCYRAVTVALIGAHRLCVPDGSPSASHQHSFTVIEHNELR